MFIKHIKSEKYLPCSFDNFLIYLNNYIYSNDNININLQSVFNLFINKFYSIKTVFCYYFIKINIDIYICIYKKLIEI